MTGADMDNANLTNANLYFAATLSTAVLTGAIWSNTTCLDGSITNTGCDLAPY
jgi:uncharacterized protein YjbI with pentapeptide repeats